jgi:uncharacterized cupredoxin-like copper-binding protein
MKWIATLFAAVLLAGCGSSSSTSSSASTASGAGSTSASTPPPAPTSASGLALSETEFKITPPTATAKVGTTTIKVTNDGKITHVLAVQTPAGLVKTGDIAPGASATLVVHLMKAGKYTFFCPIPGHRQAGMVGTLVVGSSAAASTGSSGAATTSSSTTSPSSGAGATTSGGGGGYSGSGY